MTNLPHNLEPVFLDTAYLVALVNARDQWHVAAKQWERQMITAQRAVMTTDFILIEIADALASVNFRRQAARLLELLPTNPLAEVLPASRDLLARGFDLYQARPDKDWSLTDCVSFTVMTEFGLAEALTSDHHFRQAGFRALLLEDPN